jgi:hypothetical protein
MAALDQYFVLPINWNLSSAVVSANADTTALRTNGNSDRLGTFFRKRKR